MPTTAKINIANMVFVKLGVATAASLNEATDQVNAFNAVYENARKKAISESRMRFARKRATLAKLSDGPVFGWDSAFQIPGDSLVVLETDEEGLPWTVEENRLLCNRTTVSILYITDEENTAIFPESFVDALVALLASQLAIPLRGKRDLEELQYTLYQQKIKEARVSDGQQGTPRVLEANELEDARFGTI